MATTVKKPMNPKLQLIISIAVVIAAVLLTLMVFRYPQRFGPVVVGALVVTLASFLLLLLLRHFMVIWFSYMHQRELAKGEIFETYPFVSIIVPAYNEAEVIQSSLSSLLELRYP